MFTIEQKLIDLVTKYIAINHMKYEYATANKLMVGGGGGKLMSAPCSNVVFFHNLIFMACQIQYGHNKT